MKPNTIVVLAAILALAAGSRASGQEAAKAAAGVSFAEWDAGGPRRGEAPAVQAGPPSARGTLLSAAGNGPRIPGGPPPSPALPGLASRQASDARRLEGIAAARSLGPPIGFGGFFVGAVAGAKAGAILCSPLGLHGIIGCGAAGLVAGAAAGTVAGYGVGAGAGYGLAWAFTAMGQTFDAFDNRLASRSERISSP